MVLLRILYRVCNSVCAVGFCIVFTTVVGCSRLCVAGCSVVLPGVRVLCVAECSIDLRGAALTCGKQRCLYYTELIL